LILDAGLEMFTSSNKYSVPLAIDHRAYNYTSGYFATKQ